VWSASQAHKTAVAGIHGTTLPSGTAASLLLLQQQQAQTLYAPALAALRAAYADFNRTFLASEASHLEAALFSADGDFLHAFFDCLFLGPYTRVDLRACDAEGFLRPLCPFYARDEAGGVSRNFTACFGDVMHGDHRLPYTCGSGARRSVIKYFYRNASQTIVGGKLGQNVSRLIASTVGALFANYTAPGSMGCWNPRTRTCALAGCSEDANGFAPCMTTTFQIPSPAVNQWIVNAILSELPQYYQLTQTSTVPWTAYFEDADGNPGATPARWGADPAMASAAASLSHFSPTLPVIAAYTAQASGAPLPARSPYV